jgi:hypothetical protein
MFFITPDIWTREEGSESVQMIRVAKQLLTIKRRIWK